MTSTPLWTQEDEDFLTADLSKRGTLLMPCLRAEITAERGTFIVLQQTISKLTALVENGEEITFKQVLNEEPAAWDAGQYPTAAIVADNVSEADAVNGIPFEVNDKEIFSENGEFALWEVGEDYGDAHVAIVAGSSPEANALAECVRQLFWQDIDSSTILSLPLPLSYVPAPFRFAFAKSRLRCDIWQSDKSSDTAGSSTSEKRYQRNIHFHWKAPRIIGRPALPRFGVRINPQITGLKPCSFDVTTRSKRPRKSQRLAA